MLRRPRDESTRQLVDNFLRSWWERKVWLRAKEALKHKMNTSDSTVAAHGETMNKTVAQLIERSSKLTSALKLKPGWRDLRLEVVLVDRYGHQRTQDLACSLRSVLKAIVQYEAKANVQVGGECGNLAALAAWLGMRDGLSANFGEVEVGCGVDLVADATYFQGKEDTEHARRSQLADDQDMSDENRAELLSKNPYSGWNGRDPRKTHWLLGAEIAELIGRYHVLSLLREGLPFEVAQQAQLPFPVLINDYEGLVDVIISSYVRALLCGPCPHAHVAVGNCHTMDDQDVAEASMAGGRTSGSHWITAIWQVRRATPLIPSQMAPCNAPHTHIWESDITCPTCSDTFRASHAGQGGDADGGNIADDDDDIIDLVSDETLPPSEKQARMATYFGVKQKQMEAFFTREGIPFHPDKFPVKLNKTVIRKYFPDYGEFEGHVM